MWYSLFAGAALKGTALLGAAWLAAALLRKRPASVRHLVWTAAFAAVLALPVFSLFLPSLKVPLAPALAAPATIFETAAKAPARGTVRCQTQVEPPSG